MKSITQFLKESALDRAVLNFVKQINNKQKDIYDKEKVYDVFGREVKKGDYVVNRNGEIFKITKITMAHWGANVFGEDHQGREGNFASLTSGTMKLPKDLFEKFDSTIHNSDPRREPFTDSCGVKVAIGDIVIDDSKFQVVEDINETTVTFTDGKESNTYQYIRHGHDFLKVTEDEVNDIMKVR